jgi:hypothetical protein
MQVVDVEQLRQFTPRSLQQTRLLSQACVQGVMLTL